MIINKFGGDIMGTPELVKLSAKEIKKQRAKNQHPIVVVSALKGVTDELVEIIKRLSSTRRKNGICNLFIEDITKKHHVWIDDCIPHGKKIKKIIDLQIKKLENSLNVLADFGEIKAITDTALSYGERLSSLLFAEMLNQYDVPAARFTGEEIGVVTNESFGDADIIYNESVKNISKALKSHQAKTKKGYTVPVISGFIGKTRNNQTTTLGRGGSDTTACIVGAAMKAKKIILWKNVPGVLTADPKIVKDARCVRAMSYEEAEESGKVIHDKSMVLIRKISGTVDVVYIQDPTKKTIVSREDGGATGVKIVSSKNGLRLIKIVGDKIKRYGALAEISGIITEKKINMVLIRNTRDTLYIVVEENGRDVIKSCEQKIKECDYDLDVHDVSMITIIGRLPWEIVEKFNQLLYTHANVAELGAFPYKGCVRLEAIVAPHETEKMVQLFHKEFISNTQQ